MSGAGVVLLAQGSVEIRRSRRDVFAYVSNMENFSAWFPGVVSVRAHDDQLDHGQVGKRYRETVRVSFGRTSTIDLEVKEAHPGARLITEGGGKLLPRMTVDFAALSDGETRVNWQMVTRNRRWWFRWLVVPLVRRVMVGRARKGLRRLRVELEREVQ